MNRGNLLKTKDQRTKQKGLIHKKDSSRKQFSGKEENRIERGKRNAKKLKLNISQAINEALDDLKNSQEYDEYEAELVPSFPSPVVEKEPISPVKEKQRRSSFDITHTKSPILAASESECVIEPLELESLDKFVLDVPKESVEPIEPPKPCPTEEELNNEVDRVIYILCNSKNHSKIPTKTTLSPKQESEVHSIIHQVIYDRNSLYEKTDEMDIIEYYFTTQELSHFINSLRYESPYGISPRSYLLELLCKYDSSFNPVITKLVTEFTWQFVLDERELPYQADSDFKTIQNQIGGIHRYVQLFQFLVESLRFEVAMNPPSNPEEIQCYLQQSSLLLHVLRCFVCTRTTIEKYTEMLSSLTLCLFSISPQEIAVFYQFLLKHWPRGNSEKTLGFIQFIENLLSSSPPLYLTPFLKDIVLKVFSKICQELLGSQVEISKRCAYFLQNYYLRSNYIAVDQNIVMVVKTALEKGTNHWNETIAMICEKAVDLILDDI